MPESRLYAKFQFHYGTVKSTFTRLPVWGLLHFNSTTVRLKGNTTGAAITIGTKFQFHYGTVKSSSSPSIWRPTFDFNSTTVRLKETTLEYPNLKSRHFNSTTVRLKACPAQTIKHHPLYFNSTTVRLKAGSCSCRVGSCCVISIPLRYG